MTGKVFWITGLAGSGKSTLARNLKDKFEGKTIVLDGDHLRLIFGNDIGYTREERLISAYRNARLCKFLSDEGLNVICPTISLFHEVQEWNRNNIPGYIEIFLDIDMSEIIKRDQKSLYSKALAGEIKNVVGIDIKPEYPKNPDYVYNNFNDYNKFLDEILRREYDKDCSKTW